MRRPPLLLRRGLQVWIDDGKDFSINYIILSNNDKKLLKNEKPRARIQVENVWREEIKMNSESKKTTMPMDGWEKFWTFFFFDSFLPLIFVIYKAFTGVYFYGWSFGFHGILLALLTIPLMPLILLICLIFQIGFAKNYFGNYPKLKIASRILVIVIIAAAILSNLVWEKCWDLKWRPKVENYLEELYGEKALDNTTLDDPSDMDTTIQAHTPVLPENTTFKIYVTNAMQPISDTLLPEFKDANPDFYPELKKYIREKENIPEEMLMDFDIISIQFEDYRYGDDFTVLFERTEYEIK